MSAPSPRPRYDAFISYSHRDAAQAIAVQRGLQRFAKPIWKTRNLHVYRDQTDLAASPQLWPSLTRALDDSRFLIAFLSGNSAASPWLDREVDYWLQSGRGASLLFVLVDGELVWDPTIAAFDANRSSAAPRTLTQPGALGDEPRYVDLRWASAPEDLDLRRPEFQDVVGDLAAAITGKSKSELNSEEVRAQRKLRRYRRLAISTLSVLLVLAIAASVVAVFQANRADDQRRQAERRQAQAEALEYSARSASGDPYAGLALAVEAELRTSEPTSQARLAYAQAVERLDRTPLVPAGEPAALSGREVNDVAWSPDGNRVGVAADTNISIFDRNGKHLRDLHEDRTDGLVSLAWSPGGRWIAAVGIDNDGPRVWDVVTGQRRAAPGGLSSASTRVSWSPDGSLLATAGEDGLVRIWNATTLAEQAEPIPVGEGNNAVLIAWSSDSRELITATAGGEVRWFDPMDGTPLGEPLAIEGQIGAMSSSPDGSFVAIAVDTDVVLVRPGTHERLVPTIRTGAARSLAWSPTGALLAVALDDGSLRLWSAVANQLFGDPIPAHAGGAKAIAWSPTGRELVSIGTDFRLLRWRLTDARPQAEIALGPAAAWSPSGDLAVAGKDDVVRLLDRTYHARATLSARSRGHWRRLAWSPDGARLAGIATEPDVALVVWDVGTRRLLFTAKAFVESLAWSPDGHALATGDQSGKVTIYDAITGTPLVRPWVADRSRDGNGVEPPMIQDMAWSPDGARIATLGLYTGIRVWNSGDGSAERSVSLTGATGPACVQWSPDGRAMAICRSDGHVEMRDATRLDRAGPVTAQQSGLVVGVGFSSRHSVLASVAEDGGLQLSDASTGARAADQILMSPIYLTQIGWSPADDRVATVDGYDGVRVLEPFDERQACQLVKRALSPGALAAILGPGRPAPRCLDPAGVPVLTALPLRPAAAPSPR